MILQQETTVWLPTKFHGEIPYPNGGDVTALVAAGLHNLMLPSQIPFYNTIKYVIRDNIDGSQSVFFELLS
jgi:hypothetical protein